MMDEFNPARLTLARERRSLTKEALARRCGVTRRTVTDWEAGKVDNPPVSRISKALNFPESFFSGDAIDRVANESVSFRALTSMSQRLVSKVLANASMIRAFSDWVDERYTTPPTDVPSIEELTASNLDTEPVPSDAAESLRAIWGLGATPIEDMLAIVESQGVRVFGLTSEDREVDAFSFWHNDRAFIFLNVLKSSERLRFDLAHEVGHLCMHRGIVTNRVRRFELDANIFAGNFLLPKDGLKEQIQGPPQFEDVFLLKKFWGVSATAMVRRLYQLRRISEWQYRSWMIELSQRGFRSEEPDGMPKEQSSLLRQVMEFAREDGWSIRRLSEHLGIPQSDLSAALMGLTLTPYIEEDERFLGGRSSSLR